ncbi:hypothetical protein PENSTE_c001G06847 [Penicillium steckii]|uniref:Major facilitator superfamily (MFS) profile domain-containing protein n=1 Tax=Penicillium steckii TaxID=303698 RepID=A0A1V6U1K1_9EURO|nr:hypothetical protein PENSTE_c001G06847 [Penicillium steckii]
MVGFQLLRRGCGWPMWNDRPKVYLDESIGGWNNGTIIDLSYSMQSTPLLVAGCWIESDEYIHGAIWVLAKEAGLRILDIGQLAIFVNMATMTLTPAQSSSEPPVPGHGQNIDVEDVRSIASSRFSVDETPPSHAFSVAPRWNESKAMVWRLTATCWCAFVMGANDAAYGAIISSTGAAFLELIYATSAFWTETSAKYRQESAGTTARGGALRQTQLSLTYKVTWIIAVFLFLYGGTEVAIGGWIVVFMTNIRHGSAFASGMTETGFWLGITVGRFVLGFVSPRIGEKLAVTVYIICAIALELIFWLVPEFFVSAVAVSLVGFFLGTIFPGVVVVGTRLLPKNLHVAAIGFAAAFSMGGGAVFPFMIGAIAQAKGVSVLQPVLLAMLAVALGIWSTIFKISSIEQRQS